MHKTQNNHELDFNDVKINMDRCNPSGHADLACEQVPKWGIGRRQKSSPHTALRLPGSPIFLFMLLTPLFIGLLQIGFERVAFH